MFLHIGENKTINEKDIIGIFDCDNTTTSKVTRKFLSTAQNKGEVESVGDLPKSFILVSNKTTEKIYLTQLSAKTLSGRAENVDLFERN